MTATWPTYLALAVLSQAGSTPNASSVPPSPVSKWLRLRDGQPPALAFKKPSPAAVDAGVPPTVITVSEPPPTAAGPAPAPANPPTTASPVAAVPAGPTRAEFEQVKADLAELKAKNGTSAQLEALAAQLDRVSQQLTALSAQVNDHETRRQDSERRVVERRLQTEQAVTGLNAAQQALAAGSANVLPALSAAEAVLTGAALTDVQNARAALANGDLGSARVWLGLALVEAQATKP